MYVIFDAYLIKALSEYVFFFFSCHVGMNYLHYEAPVTVIHRDLKSKNGKQNYHSTVSSQGSYS